jgi:hypothetical protein
MGYTKLFSSIIASTIWRTGDKTRLVWITMLAMADQFGVVEASVPGLSDMARVTVAECREALDELQQPDPDSRSSEQEGRRIEKVEGGWRLINHGKYREKMSRDERREYQRLYQRSYRKQNVNSDSDKLTKFDIQKQKQNRTETPVRTEVPSPAAPPTPDAFTAFWSAYPKKAGKAAALKVWKRLRPPESLVVGILAGVATAKQSRQWREGYIPNPARWLNEGRWDDEVEVARPVGVGVAASDWVCPHIKDGEPMHGSRHACDLFETLPMYSDERARLSEGRWDDEEVARPVGG